MSLLLPGGGLAPFPFDRTFFNVTFGEILNQASPGQAQTLTLFLADGSTLDVCDIDHLSDRYVSLRAYKPGEEACDTSLHLVPYSLIYRIELTPKGDASPRLGFHWTGQERRRAAVRKHIR